MGSSGRGWWKASFLCVHGLTNFIEVPRRAGVILRDLPLPPMRSFFFLSFLRLLPFSPGAHHPSLIFSPHPCPYSGSFVVVGVDDERRSGRGPSHLASNKNWKLRLMPLGIFEGNDAASMATEAKATARSFYDYFY